MSPRRGAPAPLPYSTQTIEADDLRAVRDALRSGWITQGPAVARFEADFARRVKARHAVAFSSGTAALHACAVAAGLGPGDEAVVPPLTFVATANAVLYAGATPRFCDVEADSGLLDPKRLEASITRRTKAVFPVDYAGHPCDLDAIRRIARARGLVVVEDAAHSLGARYRGRPVGALADMTVFSFHPVKHITTGEGGMVTTESEDFHRRLLLFRSHGITKDPAELSRDEGPWYYEMRELGYNYRLTDIQSALGSSQLKKMESFVNARRRLAALYDERLRVLVQIPPRRPWARHAYHLYPIRLRPGSPPRRIVFERLRAAGLGVQVHYIPVHLHPYYQERLKTRPGLCPNAEVFYAGEISLPLFPRMREKDVERVARTLKDALRAP